MTPGLRAIRLGLITGLALAELLFPVAPASATEAGAGHYVTGAAATPGAGVVPPVPGLYWSNANIFYEGTISKSLQVPVGGNLVLGLRADFTSIGFTGIYVPKVSLGPFTIAAGLTVAGQYVDAEADVGARSRSDNSGGFGDMAITPAILGWHSGHNFVQARLDIFAPTAGYNRGSLANIGMGYWTFTPTVAYTYLDPVLGIDASASLGIDFNTTNSKTEYRSGALLHLDTAFTKKIGTTGLSLGVLASMLEQIQDDSGRLARLLNGFRGQAFAVGPIIGYDFKLGRMDVSSSLRWAPEFATRNRPTGNAVYLTFAGRF